MFFCFDSTEAYECDTDSNAMNCAIGDVFGRIGNVGGGNDDFDETIPDRVSQHVDFLQVTLVAQDHPLHRHLLQAHQTNLQPMVDLVYLLLLYLLLSLE